MGFYGNITNTARTQFQFDKVYASRKAMDEAASTDGVYAGRYVLVNYDDNGGLDYYLQAFKNIKSVVNETTGVTEPVVCLGPSVNGETILDFKYVATAAEVQDNDVVYDGQLLMVPGDGQHNLVNPTSVQTEWWKVSGFKTDNTTGIKYAVFSEWDNPYSANFNEDLNAYGTSRGYDSTVWQKTYQNGQDKYIMVAELNTMMPILDIASEAPRMVPLTPHFGADSTNIYYKLHWSPNWGLRIKAANSDLVGPLLNKDGAMIPNTSVSMSSDTKDYLSDERIHWYNSIYNDYTGITTKQIFALSGSAENQGTWVTENSVSGEVATAPAAIYYNKAGFNPERTYYAYKKISLQARDYKPNVYYEKINGKYVLSNTGFIEGTDYYEKIADIIKLEPTGHSGHSYSDPSAASGESVQPDTQELSIMLPTIGNTIAAVWDLVYGGEDVNDGPVRNMDVSWEAARAGLNRSGLRLINDYNFDGQYVYTTKNVDTIAGAINSVHDLMGMIITSANHESLMDSIDDLDSNRIYYDRDTHTFNRKTVVYDYDVIDNNDFDYYYYDEIEITPEEWAPGIYCITNDNGVTFEVDTNNAYDENQTYYLKKFQDGLHDENVNAEYEEKDISEMEVFDGSLYAYRDYTGADVNDYHFEKNLEVNDGYTVVLLDENTWEANTYYIKVNGVYQLDSAETYLDQTYYAQTTDTSTIYAPGLFYIPDGEGYALDYSDQFDPNKTYYNIVYTNTPLSADYVRDSKYYKDKTYYRWDEIEITPYSNLSSEYEPNKFYIQNAQGDFILSKTSQPEPDVTYYVLKEENLRTLASLNKQNIYIPGKYLYKDTTDNKYKIDGALIMHNGTHYLLDAGNQEKIADNFYIKTITYEPVAITAETYLANFYYIIETSIVEGQQVSNYVICTRSNYQPDNYFIKQEVLTQVGNTYFEIDPATINNYQVSLIQFHRGEFFYRTTDNNFIGLNTLEDIANITNVNNIYVLRNSPSRPSGEPNGGTYILNNIDYSRPGVSAMITQTEFYRAGKFHYLNADYQVVQLTPDTYVPNKFYTKVNNNYVISTAAQYDVNNEPYYMDCSDYLLSMASKKDDNKQYFTITSVGEPIETEFLETYEYYENVDGEYVLITDNSTLPDHVYEKKSYYVYEDDAHIYPKGMPWSFNATYVPASVTLATRTKSFGLEPFEDFARNINTMHGMLLKTKAMLDYNNKDTRDLRTVQGALNTLNDKIAQFSTWTPGQIIMADRYGRLQGASVIDSDWIGLVSGFDKKGNPTLQFINNNNAKYTYGDDPYSELRYEFWREYNDAFLGLYVEPFENSNRVGLKIKDSGTILYNRNSNTYSVPYIGDITHDLIYVYDDDLTFMEASTPYEWGGEIDETYIYVLADLDLDTAIREKFIPTFVDMYTYRFPDMTVDLITTEIYEKGENWTSTEETITFRDIAQVFSGENKKLAGNITYQYADEYTYEQEVEDPYLVQRQAFWTQYDEFSGIIVEDTEEEGYVSALKILDNSALTYQESPEEFTLSQFGDLTQLLFKIYDENNDVIATDVIVSDPEFIYDSSYTYVILTWSLDRAIKERVIASLIENSIITGMTVNEVISEIYEKNRNWTPDPITITVPAKNITYEEVVEKVNTIDDLHNTTINLQNQIDYGDQNFIFLCEYLGLTLKESSFTIPSADITTTAVGYSGTHRIVTVTDPQQYGLIWNIDSVYGDQKIRIVSGTSHTFSTDNTSTFTQTTLKNSNVWNAVNPNNCGYFRVNVTGKFTAGHAGSTYSVNRSIDITKGIAHTSTLHDKVTHSTLEINIASDGLISVQPDIRNDRKITYTLQSIVYYPLDNYTQFSAEYSQDIKICNITFTNARNLAWYERTNLSWKLASPSISNLSIPEYTINYFILNT